MFRFLAAIRFAFHKWRLRRELARLEKYAAEDDRFRLSRAARKLRESMEDDTGD